MSETIEFTRYLSTIALFFSFILFICLAIFFRRIRKVFILITSLCFILLVIDGVFAIKEFFGAKTTNKIAPVKNAKRKLTKPIKSKRAERLNPPPRIKNIAFTKKAKRTQKKHGKPTRTERSKVYRKPDGLLGYRPINNVESIESKYINNFEIYKDLLIKIDSKGRRSCDSPGNNRDPSNKPALHAIFLGGSFTFGSGVPADNTLPCEFEKLSNNKLQAFNYGVHGYGTGQMYLMLDEKDLFSDIKQKRGIIVYVFLSNHVIRNVGHYLYSRNNPYYPMFRLENGRLDGPYRARELFWTDLAIKIKYEWARYSPTLRFLAPRIKRTIDKDSVDITIQLIIESKTKYAKMFKGQFIVLPWPSHTLKKDLEDYFVEKLTNAGINVFKPPPLPKSSSASPGLHKLDPHPSPAMHGWVAKNLIDYVQSMEMNNTLYEPSNFAGTMWKKSGGVRVSPDAAIAPDGIKTADRLFFNPESSIIQYDNEIVEAGDTVVSRVWLWADKPVRMRLAVFRHCSGEMEGREKIIEITTKPKRFEVSHKFKQPHDCVRFHLRPLKNESAEVYAWNAELRR